jgi:hypothetical protein
MSAEMRSFMGAYGAVHNKEVKENLDNGRDSISEMNLSKLTDSDLCEAVEEVLEVWFAEGHTVPECEAIAESILPSSEMPGRQAKIDRLQEAFASVLGRVKEKSARTAVESFALYRKGKQVKESWSNKFSHENGNEKLHERLVAADFVGVKNGLLELAKKPEFAGNYEGPLYAPHPDIEEGYKEIDKKKENAMYRRAGNLARKGIADNDSKAKEKSAKIVTAITRQKENERFSKMADEKARDNYKEELEFSQIRKDWAAAYKGIYEAAKPDYLDFDKDGDEEESMKKALKDKEGKCKKCGKEPCECPKEDVKEAKEKWIGSAIKKPGALHKMLGVPEGENIPESKLRAAAKQGGKLGQRARLALTLKGLNKEETDWEFLDNLIESEKFTEQQIQRIAEDL